MTIQSQDSKFENLPEANTSPVYVAEGNLHVNATEWSRLCGEQSTGPLVSVLSDARGFLSRGKAVRLIDADGGIAVAADQPNQFQAILDDVNRRRANLGLAPAIPLD
jgi:hypothetical protein